MFGLWLNTSRAEVRHAASIMAGISAFINGASSQLFKAISESDEEGEALFSLEQSRQGVAGIAADTSGMEPGDLMQ